MSGRSIEQRAARIFLASSVATTVTMVMQLACVPICLAYWGSETYGLWLAVFAAFMMLRAPDAGFTAYVGNKVNLQFHQEAAALRATLASALIGSLILGLVQLLLTLCAVVLAGARLFPSGGNFEAGLALALLMAVWVLSGPYVGVVHRLLVAAGLMHEAIWWGAAYQACQVVGLVACALMRLSILQSSVVLASIQTLVYVASAVYVRRRLPEYYPWWRDARAARALKDLQGSLPLMTANLFQQLGTNGLVLVAALALGPTAVAAFVTVRTLTNLWANLLNVLTTPFLPDVVRYHATGQVQKLLALTEAHWLFVGTTINLSIVFALPVIAWVYTTWTHQVLALDTALLCFLLSSIIFATFGSLIGTYLSGINNVRFVMWTSLIRGVGGVAGAATLLPHYGLMSLGLSVMVMEVLAAVFVGLVLFRREVAALGSALRWRSVAPISVCSAGVVALLMFEAFEPALSRLAYPLVSLTTLASLLAGWRVLDPEVRGRTLTLFGVRKVAVLRGGSVR